MKRALHNSPKTSLGGIILAVGCVMLVLFGMTESVGFLADWFTAKSHWLLFSGGFLLVGIGGFMVGVHAQDGD